MPCRAPPITSVGTSGRIRSLKRSDCRTRFGTVAIEVVDRRIAAFTLAFEVRNDTTDAFEAFPPWLTGSHPGLVNVLFGDEEWIASVSDEELQTAADELLAVATAFGSSDLPDVQALMSHPVIVASSNWFNSNGLMRLDVELWQGRIGEACGADASGGAWDHAVARALADRFLAEDRAALKRPEAGDGDQAALVVWLMARNYCPEQFSDADIAAGPPRP